MARIIWTGVSEKNNDVRVIDLGNGVTPRMTVEYLSGRAAMGEPIWTPLGQLDLTLMTTICLQLGIIQ